eukprot:TRINITY_DN50372_c0_g1_i1.p1 TRINITY_DN50372_c0_g1~~TRINITY_DN50372_c0_g1_i1.p1  ORF type:complete len:103 (+),score=21.83 TRINITY_DN50372_c0_g1_i1:77-385(+)
MSVSKEFVMDILLGLKAWASDPANEADVAECKAMLEADSSEEKIDGKKMIMTRMVMKRVEQKPESQLAAFTDDVTPLWDALMACREDPQIDKAYEDVKFLFQ